MNKRYIFTFIIMLLTLTSWAQQRKTTLTIQVTSVEGDYLEGQAVTLRQTEWDVSYGNLTLDANGECTLRIYSGQHSIDIDRDGFLHKHVDFNVPEEQTTYKVDIALEEQTREPFTLKATTTHDATTGSTDVLLEWNTEAPAFFDDFESYEPWAINFGEWTGIDADQEAAAPLLGSYPNRGVMQYAQVINPLTVEPTWWYDYPILRPFSGKQYVGFTRTNSGLANDDWLISPLINVGTDNILSFVGKAADQYAERFMVYICEVTPEHPGDKQADFTRIDEGNYETADYRGWREYNYDLSAYAGRPVKFAIRYISEYNRYGSFMLMIDDVFVGQPESMPLTARKARRNSPANPNERFLVFLDGQQVGTTEDYSYLLHDVQPGSHVLGVKAVYKAAESSIVTLPLTIAADAFSRVVFNVTADSKLSTDGLVIQLVSTTTSTAYSITVKDGQAVLASLPNDSYIVNIAEGAFNEYLQTISVTADGTFDIVLTDHILAPFNITANNEESGDVILRWNQELIFSDSFEEYEDFATGTFGEWRSYDLDQQPVYPIGLGSTSNIVSFPGSGTATNPSAIPPIVFNPWKTTPAMLPTDAAIAAPTGDKTVVFFSPQRVQADKWLISPLLDIHDAYQLSVKAKAYASYPEKMEFCISTEGSTQPADFTVLSIVDPVSAGQWALYETSLADYAGQRVRLAIHYTSVDAFFVQVDDFTVGPASGEGEVVDYGNIVRFDIYVDGVKVGESLTPTFTLSGLAEGQHTVGIKSIYKSGESAMTEYVIQVEAPSSVLPATVVRSQTTKPEYYNLQGQRLSAGQQTRGIVIVKNGNVIKKLHR